MKNIFSALSSRFLHALPSSSHVSQPPFLQRGEGGCINSEEVCMVVVVVMVEEGRKGGKVRFAELLI